MTVRIEKPALNLREEINRLDKPTGIAGEAMLRADTVAEQQALIGVGRRNMIINGDFRVSQRGDYTSATTITNGTYYLDRCVSYAGNVGGAVQDMGGSIKHTATSSTVGYLGLEQKIEDYSRLGGETITVSAEVKSNHSSAQIMIYDSAYRDGVHHSGSGDWEKLTHTFTVNTSLSRLWVQVWISDSASSLNVNMTSGDYIEVRNFQVERGKIATPFEHRSYVEELALCQRYFERLEDLGSTDSNGAASTETLIGIGYVYTTTRVMGHVTWKATKRVNPTCTVSPVTDIQCLSSAVGWISATGVDVRANKNSARLDITTGSAMPAAGQACEIRFNTASPVGYIYIDAEL